jgi:glycosyltransferase involved in cell wall biosynthesis
MASESAGPPVAVSIIIPTYNLEAFVMEAVESALRQTFGDREVVVVDDGSTDSTPEVLARYGDGIRVVRQPNAGLAAARNRGAQEARGRWLAFLDADDAWEPQRLDRMFGYLRDHPDVKVVATGALVITARGVPTRRRVLRKSPGDRITTVDLLTRDKGLINGGGVLIERDRFFQMGGFDPAFPCVEDCDLWLRLSRRAPIAFLNEPLLLYRWHDRNMSYDILQNARSWLVVLEKFRREQPEFVRRHPWVFRQALSRQYLRLGRELLARDGADVRMRREACQALLRSLRLAPRLRPGLYLLAGWAAPRLYARFRRWEIARRHHAIPTAQ